MQKTTMKKNILGALAAGTATAAIALASALLPTGAQAQTYTKQQLQETYSGYLSTEGYKPEITPSP